MLEWGSCKQITGRRKQESLLQSQASNSNAWMEVLWANNVWKVAACGGSQPYVLLFIQHMEESSQPLHTSSTKYTYIYIYIKFGLVLFLSSPLPKEKNKHTNKKFLEKKNNGTTNPPPPFTSFWSLILFYSFINHDLVNLLQTLFTIFYFISVLVMSSLLCSKVNMCSRAFICLVFLVMGSHP